MDLALELGMTVRELSQRMTEREFVRWQHYAARKMLPTQRAQMQAALIGLTVARCMGGNESLTLRDFLFEEVKPEKTTTPEEGVNAIRAFSGGSGVVRLGQRRKRGG